MCNYNMSVVLSRQYIALCFAAAAAALRSTMLRAAYRRGVHR